MVSEHACRGAAFGKPDASASAGDDRYQLLFFSEGFPEAAVDALIRLAGAVQWQGGADAALFPPSFAIWPVDAPERNGMLTARLLDSGRDGLGRPHTLRVEAVYFEAQEPLDVAEVAARHLALSGWPAEPWPSAAEIRLASDAAANDGLSRSVAELASRLHRVPRYLVSGHGFFFAQGFDAIETQNNGGAAVNVRPTIDNGGEPALRRGNATARSATQARPCVRFPIAIATFALICGAVGGFAVGVGVERMKRGSELRTSEEATEAQVRRAREIEARLLAAERDDVVAKRSLEELRAQQEAFQDYHRVLKEFDIISPDHLRARLRRWTEE